MCGQIADAETSWCGKLSRASTKTRETRLDVVNARLTSRQLLARLESSKQVPLQPDERMIQPDARKTLAFSHAQLMQP